MEISVKYICPVRGLATLEPPDPTPLGQASKVAENLGVKRLLMPVLEESLTGATKSTITFLDGLLRALDQVEKAGLTAWLVAPARRLLGLDWVPPYLVQGGRDPRAGLVFLEGRVRNVWPYNWWEDISVLQRRIKLFRELVSAVAGHPALTGWIIMDRALEWVRPELEMADLLLKSYTAEIRERDEQGTIILGLGWSELLYPEMAQSLTSQVDVLLMSGLDKPPFQLNGRGGLVTELLTSVYLGNLTRWLFGRPVEVEVGWGVTERIGEPEEIMETLKGLAHQGLPGVNWMNLMDPEPSLCSHPPWTLRDNMERTGLLDQGMEPKENVEDWLNKLCSISPDESMYDFIDISVEEYLDEPEIHFHRLWDHFLE